VHVSVELVGRFEGDAKDLTGGIVREIHRRLLEFERPICDELAL
jgi:hypothetical protein